MLGMATAGAGAAGWVVGCAATDAGDGDGEVASSDVGPLASV